LFSVGIPPLHIVKAHNGVQYRFYELTGDLQDALHFHHFEKAHVSLAPAPAAKSRVHIKAEVKLKNTVSNAGRHIKLH
jgi:hypothetical protein